MVKKTLRERISENWDQIVEGINLNVGEKSEYMLLVLNQLTPHLDTIENVFIPYHTGFTQKLENIPKDTVSTLIKMSIVKPQQVNIYDKSQGMIKEEQYRLTDSGIEMMQTYYRHKHIEEIRGKKELLNHIINTPSF